MKKMKMLSNEEVATFCRELSILLCSGITPFEALNYMRDDSVSEDGQKIIKSIQASLQEHKLFFDALADAKVFPQYMVSMVQLGEETGHLDETIARLATYYEQQVSIKKSIINTITYPGIMLCLMLVIIFLLLTKILPILDQVFAQLGSQFQGFAKTLLHFGNLLNTLSFIFLILLMIICFMFFFFTKCDKGKLLGKKMLQSFSFSKQLALDIAFSRFAACLSLIQVSGIDLYTGLTMIDTLLDHPLMSCKIGICKKAILQHEFLYDALKQAEIFKPSQIRLLQIAYKMGNAEKELDNISTYYENLVNEKIQSFLEIIEPTLVIIFSLIVGSILLSVILPLVGVMSQIG